MALALCTFHFILTSQASVLGWTQLWQHSRYPAASLAGNYPLINTQFLLKPTHTIHKEGQIHEVPTYCLPTARTILLLHTNLCWGPGFHFLWMFQICVNSVAKCPHSAEKKPLPKKWETYSSPQIVVWGAERWKVSTTQTSLSKEKRLQSNTGMQSGKHRVKRTMINYVIQDSVLFILQFINFCILDLTILILQRILKIATDVIIYGLHTVIVRNQKRRQKNGRLSFPENHWKVYMKSLNTLWSSNVHLTVSHYKLERKCCPHNVDFKSSCKDLERQ